jgi:hypothetical protein
MSAADAIDGFAACHGPRPRVLLVAEEHALGHLPNGTGHGVRDLAHSGYGGPATFIGARTMQTRRLFGLALILVAVE